MEAAELDAAIDELEIRLERLRALYEQYFLGIEKLEPSVARKDVDRRIWMLRKAKIRNTARRFKLQTLIQRYNTFQQYWQRICREIEHGTYRRHVLRAERSAQRTQDEQTDSGSRLEAAAAAQRAARESAHDLDALLESGVDISQAAQTAIQQALGGSQPLDPRAPVPARRSEPPRPPTRPQRPRPAKESLGALSLDAELESPTAPARRKPPLPPGAQRAGAQRAQPLSDPSQRTQVRPAPPPPAPATKGKAPPPRRPASALSEARIRELHDSLVRQKRQNHEPAEVSVQAVAKSLRAAEAKLRKQHGNRTIDFKVVVKNGKAILKPVVR